MISTELVLESCLTHQEFIESLMKKILNLKKQEKLLLKNKY